MKQNWVTAAIRLASKSPGTASQTSDFIKAMMEGTSPKTVTTRRRIKYVESTWRVHQFEIWSGEMICRAATVRMKDSVLVWVGGAGQPALGEVALGLPGGGQGGGQAALATALLGLQEGHAAALARRLAATLRHPVYVACGAAFDRFTLPLLERALVAEMKKNPESF